MAREDKKEPISDLTKHNLKREEEVRAATKRLDEYLVTKFDLNKPKSARGVGRKNTEGKTEDLRGQRKKDQTAKNAEDKNDKKAEEKESEIKATEK